MNAHISPIGLPSYPYARIAPVKADRLHLLWLHALLMTTLALGCVLLVTLKVHESQENHTPIALGCGLAVMGLILYTRYFLRRPWASASIVYLALFWMFHYGMAFTSVIVPSVLEPFEAWEVAWLYWPNVRMAMILGVCGAAGFVLGIGLFVGRTPDVPPSRATVQFDGVLYAIGWVVLLAGLIASAVALVVGGGISVLSASYGVFRETVLEGTMLWVTIRIAELGCLMAICGASGGKWKWPLAAWSLLGLVLMLVGLRNEAMIPLIAFAIVLMHRGVRFRRSLLIGAVLTSLVVIPVIRVIRDVGIGNSATVDWKKATPIETFTELGGTLRAAKAYVDWIQGGEPYLLGASYWAPIDRQLLKRVIPGHVVPTYTEDRRVPAREIGSREGSVGSSATGEAYYNFGPFGPFIFFGCLGALFGWLESRAGRGPYQAAILGVVMIVLYFEIRSEWLPVPGQIGFCLGMLWSCQMLGDSLRRRKRVAFSVAAGSPRMRPGA